MCIYYTQYPLCQEMNTNTSLTPRASSRIGSSVGTDCTLPFDAPDTDKTLVEGSRTRGCARGRDLTDVLNSVGDKVADIMNSTPNDPPTVKMSPAAANQLWYAIKIASEVKIDHAAEIEAYLAKLARGAKSHTPGVHNPTLFKAKRVTIMPNDIAIGKRIRPKRS